MNKIKRYFRGVVEQGKMVRWPKRKEGVQAVGIVFGVVLVAAVSLVISDWIVSGLLKSLDLLCSVGLVKPHVVLLLSKC